MPESATIMESKSANIFADDQRAYQDFVRFGKFFTSRLVWHSCSRAAAKRSGHRAQPNGSRRLVQRAYRRARRGNGRIATPTAVDIRRRSRNSRSTFYCIRPTANSYRSKPGRSTTMRPMSTRVSASARNSIITVHSAQVDHCRESCHAAYRYCARNRPPTRSFFSINLRRRGKRLDLGAGHREVRLGALPCPFGSFSVDLRYRTSMVIAASLDENNRPALSHRQHLSSQHRCTTTRTGNNHHRRRPAAIIAVSDVYSTFSTSPAAAADHLPWYPQQTQFKLGHSGSSSDESAASLLHTKRNNSSGDDTVFRMDAATAGATPDE